MPHLPSAPFVPERAWHRSAPLPFSPRLQAPRQVPRPAWLPARLRAAFAPQQGLAPGSPISAPASPCPRAALFWSGLLAHLTHPLPTPDTGLPQTRDPLETTRAAPFPPLPVLPCRPLRLAMNQQIPPESGWGPVMQLRHPPEPRARPAYRGFGSAPPHQKWPGRTRSPAGLALQPLPRAPYAVWPAPDGQTHGTSKMARTRSRWSRPGPQRRPPRLSHPSPPGTYLGPQRSALSLWDRRPSTLGPRKAQLSGGRCPRPQPMPG